MSSDQATLRNRIETLAEAARSLEPDAAERAALRGTVLRSSERFLEALATQRAFVETAEPALSLLDTPITELGMPAAAAMAIVDEHVVPPGGHPAAPGHLAYLTGGGIYHAAIAEYFGAVTNKYAGIFFTGPGPVRMESVVTRWVADLVGYPATAAGAILSGGSLANFTAVVAARTSHQIRSRDVSSTVAYLTNQTHHATHKALRLAGLEEAVVRQVPIDQQFRMRPDALAAMIAEDRRAGLRPWLIAATAGTTDTGAVDPLDQLADIAEREQCWFHVDAAYGGFFLLTERGRQVMAGIERSDSVVLDPHKSLFLPWGTGIVLARDAHALTDAFAETGPYLQDAHHQAELSPADLSPELTKPFRALTLWFPLVHLGVAPFRAALEEKLLLAQYFRAAAADLGFSVGPNPDLSVVTFRWAPPTLSDAEADRFNLDLCEALRREGRVFLSSTQIDGRYTLRMAALAHRTHLATVDLLLELLRGHVAVRGGSRDPRSGIRSEETRGSA